MPYAVASDAAAIVYDGGGHFVTLLSQEATVSGALERQRTASERS